jgi:hypothetical protein
MQKTNKCIDRRKRCVCVFFSLEIFAMAKRDKVGLVIFFGFSSCGWQSLKHISCLVIYHAPSKAGEE